MIAIPITVFAQAQIIIETDKPISKETSEGILSLDKSQYELEFPGTTDLQLSGKFSERCHERYSGCVPIELIIIKNTADEVVLEKSIVYEENIEMKDKYQFHTTVKLETTEGRHTISGYGEKPCNTPVYTTAQYEWEKSHPCIMSTRLGPLSFNIVSNSSKYSTELSINENKLIDLLFEKILNYHKSKNYQEIITTANDILEINSYDVNAFNQLGIAYYELGQYSNATSNSKKSLFLEPSFTEPMTNLGNVYAVQGDYDTANLYFEKVLKLEPKNTDAYLGLAKIDYTIKNYHEALFWIDELLLVDANNPEAFNVKGQILAQMGQHEDAITNYNKSLSIEPNNKQTISNKQISLDELNILNQLGTQNLMIIGIVAVISIMSIIVVIFSKKRKSQSRQISNSTRKFCRKCGSVVDPKSKFCGKCGVSQ